MKIETVSQSDYDLLLEDHELVPAVLQMFARGS